MHGVIRKLDDAEYIDLGPVLETDLKAATGNQKKAK